MSGDPWNFVARLSELVLAMPGNIRAGMIRPTRKSKPGSFALVLRDGVRTEKR